MDLRLVILLLLLVLVFVLGFALRWTLGKSSRASRARNARAGWGEIVAEDLLESAGFSLVARQVTRRWEMWIDGEAVEVGVRVDLVVSRSGRHYVAEIKTGEWAPDPAWPATRRQLMEYGLVFPDHGLLLVDVEGELIHEVVFPDRVAMTG